jgi:hypothetical protein
MEIRFYIDSETGEPHILGHNIEEWEATDILKSPELDYNGRRGTRVAVGQTRYGRYLRVIYRRLKPGDVRLVITAYDLSPKAKAALRRRRRK